MSVVILSSSFKDLLLFDLKVFGLFFCGSALFNKRREEELFSLKNSFFDFLFVCLRSRFLRFRVYGLGFHFEVKSQPLLSLLLSLS